jgi:predicted nucleic acid-binding protein
VVQEFASVSLHKFKVPLQKEDLQDYLALRLWPKCWVFPTEAIFAKAFWVREKFGFRFYDSLIVASALAGGAAVLFSEDMQHGQKIGSLQILNPFREIRV